VTSEDDRSEPGSPRERFVREAGVLPWSELVRHFARGVVVKVGLDTDLIEAALCFADDDVSRVAAWLEAGHVARASDDDARDWTARAPEFRCVVVAPWVLVQER